MIYALPALPFLIILSVTISNSIFVMVGFFDDFWTLPILPESNSTLIPCGCMWLEVSIRLTVPEVNFQNADLVFAQFQLSYQLKFYF